jgi:hypothetical protein
MENDKLHWGRPFTETTKTEALLARGHALVEQLIPLSAKVRPQLTDSDCQDMNAMATLALNGAGWRPTEETRAAVEALLYFGIMLGIRLGKNEPK